MSVKGALFSTIFGAILGCVALASGAESETARTVTARVAADSQNEGYEAYRALDGNPESGNSLGVEGLWLTPVFLSPSYHKYDVTDYYQIDPSFGTEEDLKELIALCHERDVKLILDLPLNQTAKLLDMNENTAKQKLYKAIRTIRRKYTRRNGND